MISTYREVERYLSKSWKPLHGRPILELRERTSGGEGLSKSQWLVRFTLKFPLRLLQCHRTGEVCQRQTLAFAELGR